jgi:DNA ligase-associated metallophosphoesterase
MRQPPLPGFDAAGEGTSVRRMGDGTIVAQVGGETVAFLADRALWWAREATLFVADVHLGKAATLRAGGIAVPRGATAADLARLAALVDRMRARRLVVLGDFLHARSGRVAALDATFAGWRGQRSALDLVLVRGNHDAAAGDPPADWRIDVRAAPLPLGPFVLQHEPDAPRSGYALCGHLHPGVHVRGGGDAARLPCFVVGPRRTVLPAFGRLTGLALVAPRAGETRIAIAGSTLHIVPAVAPD